MGFLDHLIESFCKLSHSALENMQMSYSLSKTRNVEVSFRWCLLGCKCRWSVIVPTAQKFLATHGRGIYVKPLYMALQAFDPKCALETFHHNQNFYMAVIAKQIAV